jgi:acylphosphatase
MSAAGRARVPMSAAGRARVRIRVEGIVQGVGFRPFVHALAHRLGLAGFVGNDARGVVVEVEGGPAAVARFRAALERPRRLPGRRPPRGALPDVPGPALLDPRHPRVRPPLPGRVASEQRGHQGAAAGGGQRAAGRGQPGRGVHPGVVPHLPRRRRGRRAAQPGVANRGPAHAAAGGRPRPGQAVVRGLDVGTAEAGGPHPGGGSAPARRVGQDGQPLGRRRDQAARAP